MEKSKEVKQEGTQGRGRGGNPRTGRKPEEEWIPVTKLGRLVKQGQIKSLDEIYHHSIQIKEYQIVDHLLPELHEEVMKIMSVQKQTRSGQRTRFKAMVIVGDKKKYVGFGVKCAKEVALAIRGAIIAAKLSIIPVRLGFWGNAFGAPHTVPVKTTGKCGSVVVNLIPAPKGTGVVAGNAPKKLLEFSGIQDCFTDTRGETRTIQNFLTATFSALENCLGFLTPDLWKDAPAEKTPVALAST